jgi:hypothetical protein
MNHMKASVLKLVVIYKPVEEGLEALLLHFHHLHLGIIHPQGTENEIVVLVEGLIVREAFHLCVVALREISHHVDAKAAMSVVVAFHLTEEIVVWNGGMTEVNQEIDMSAAVDVIGAHLHVADAKGQGYQENGACPPEETAAFHQDVREVHLTGMIVHFSYLF